MPFEFTRFVQGLLALKKPQDLLDHARRAGEAWSGRPAFGAHLQPGKAWASATLSTAHPLSAAERSALHALYRRVSLSLRPIRLVREAGTEPVFRALLPLEVGAIRVHPLRNRSDRLTGFLAIAVPPVDGDPGAGAGDGPPDSIGTPGSLGGLDTLDAIEAIAGVTGPAMETAWEHAAALRDQERLQLFSETTEETVWDWRVATSEVWWGGNVDQLFGGADRSTMRGDWRKARVHPEDRARVSASFSAALNGKVSAWNDEYRLLDHGDSPVFVREHVYFLREADGQAYRAIGSVRDITALKQLLSLETAARSEAERANLVKDHFLAMLGHELRNPLAPIVSALAILERRATGSDRTLEILRRQTQHLVRLVDDLLDVARISSGKVDLTREQLALGPVIHRAVEMVHPVLEQRRHVVELRIDESLTVHADAARITQVLTNLLTNAARYSEPGGLIRIAAVLDAGWATVSVQDQGIGIPAEVLPTIFDLFAQGQQAIDRAQGGLGLGLSIVKNIVQLHGGTVEARSEGVGHGTTVTVRLPWVEIGTAQAEQLGSSSSSSATIRDILVVDDNEDAANSLAELLKTQGHRVRAASHPVTALQLAAESAPDIALVDIGLPEMDGYELARRLRRQLGVASATRLVALTGYGLVSDRAKAMSAGFDEHVVKPVSPERLAELIATLGHCLPASSDEGGAFP